MKLQKAFLVGDNIYRNGEEDHFVPKFKEIYNPLFSKGIEFHAALGNHDVQKCFLQLL